MKRFLLITLILLFFIGCGGGNPQEIKEIELTSLLSDTLNYNGTYVKTQGYIVAGDEITQNNEAAKQIALKLNIEDNTGGLRLVDKYSGKTISCTMRYSNETEYNIQSCDRFLEKGRKYEIMGEISSDSEGEYLIVYTVKQLAY